MCKKTYVGFSNWLATTKAIAGRQIFFITKIESILFVPENLSFSENLRCLNFPLWTFWPAKTKQVKESDLF